MAIGLTCSHGTLRIELIVVVNHILIIGAQAEDQKHRQLKQPLDRSLKRILAVSGLTVSGYHDARFLAACKERWREVHDLIHDALGGLRQWRPVPRLTQPGLEHFQRAPLARDYDRLRPDRVEQIELGACPNEMRERSRRLDVLRQLLPPRRLDDLELAG